MAASIIAVGNPGAGKSTILNCLAGEILFKSGVSIGEGLTYQLEERMNKRGHFFDTPGLADDKHQDAAAHAIVNALRKGGPYKILFFVRLEAGRIVREDITTFKLVLASAPEIGNKYGIVTNKLPNNVAKLIQDPDKAEQLLTKLFASIPVENRCPASSITYLIHNPDADSVDDYLLDLNSLITLDGEYFSDFVYRQIETVQLTIDQAEDIQIENFDKTTKLIETLEKKMEEDKQTFQEQQRLMVKQLEKAEIEKKEQQETYTSMFNQQMEMLRKQMENKDAEIEVVRNDAEHRERLQQEQIKNQQEYQMQEFQKQQLELASYRERNRIKQQKKNEKRCIVM